MKPRHILAVLIASLTLSPCLNRAAAEPVTWEFAGEITFVRDDEDFLGGAVVLGSPFAGAYTFESTTPDSSPDDPTRGTYNDAITAVSGQVGTVSFFGPVGTVNWLTILDDLSMSDSDEYGISVDIELLGKTVVFRWILSDETAAIFSDDSLPVSPPDLGSFYTRRLDIFSESETNPFFLSGQLTSLVPEPGTLALLGVGGLLVAIRRRRRSGQSFRKPERHWTGYLHTIALLVALTSGVRFSMAAPPSPSEDCNNNGLPDFCDLKCVGTCNRPGCGESEDCNGNWIPDECEIDQNTTAPGGGLARGNDPGIIGRQRQGAHT